MKRPQESIFSVVAFFEKKRRENKDIATSHAHYLRLVHASENKAVI